MLSTRRHVVALSGGVGGAKLAYGLAQCLAPEQLTIVANTGDDFEHLGLHIAPDLDSVMYALSEQDDPVRGWGIAHESWSFLSALEKLGGACWFQLGDRDLATHVLRSHAIGKGRSLSQVTAQLGERLGIAHRLLPMSDDPVRTVVHTDEGDLPFQHYFVQRRCEPRVSGFTFEGASGAAAQPELMHQLTSANLAGVVICPSNPYVSVDPILSLPGVRDGLKNCAGPVVAVSPIVAGKALKGPAAKMLKEMGKSVSVLAVAEHYRDFLDTLIIDQQDAGRLGELEALGVSVVITDTIMDSAQAKTRLAEVVIQTLTSKV